MPAARPKKNPAATRSRRKTTASRPVSARRLPKVDHPSAGHERRRITAWFYPLLTVASYLLGLSSGYAVWGREARAADPQAPAAAPDAGADQAGEMDMQAMFAQVNPAEGYELPARYGQLGPRLLENGVIDFDAFAALYQSAGSPLTAGQIGILTQGSNEPVVFTAENAHFLLNFFWAVGLANKNTILTDGPMVQYSNGQIESFASTGGWTLGAKPVTELYASVGLISLTPEQQAHVEEAASAIYRPCCNNPTLFPDCNHGMAMLGLLELMASQGASMDEMFEAAKYVNAYWFPQQALETAVYLKANQGTDFVDAEARRVTGREFFSGSGFGSIHASLQASGWLPPQEGRGGSCAN